MASTTTTAEDKAAKNSRKNAALPLNRPNEGQDPSPLVAAATAAAANAAAAATGGDEAAAQDTIPTTTTTEAITDAPATTTTTTTTTTEEAAATAAAEEAATATSGDPAAAPAPATTTLPAKRKAPPQDTNAAPPKTTTTSNKRSRSFMAQVSSTYSWNDMLFQYIQYASQKKNHDNAVIAAKQAAAAAAAAAAAVAVDPLPHLGNAAAALVAPPPPLATANDPNLAAAPAAPPAAAAAPRMSQALEAFCKKQRRQYQGGPTKYAPANDPWALNEERIEALNFTGFVWKELKPQTLQYAKLWNQRFAELVEYKRINGHCNVPQGYGPLGKWVKNQREAKKEALRREGKEPGRVKVTVCLSQEREDKLTAIGFIWRRRAANMPDWEGRYQQLIEYKRQNGDTLVPQSYPPDKTFGKWVMKQRCEYSQLRRGLKSNMTDERIRKLNDIGFYWVSPKFKPKKDHPVAVGGVPPPAVVVQQQQQPEEPPRGAPDADVGGVEDGEPYTTYHHAPPPHDQPPPQQQQQQPTNRYYL